MFTAQTVSPDWTSLCPCWVSRLVRDHKNRAWELLKLSACVHQWKKALQCNQFIQNKCSAQMHHWPTSKLSSQSRVNPDITTCHSAWTHTLILSSIVCDLPGDNHSFLCSQWRQNNHLPNKSKLSIIEFQYNKETCVVKGSRNWTSGKFLLFKPTSLEIPGSCAGLDLLKQQNGFLKVKLILQELLLIVVWMSQYSLCPLELKG